jgi:hypothetical protein
MLVARFDRRLWLYIAGAALGVLLYILAVLGEFVFHWWNDFGLFLALGGIVLTLALGITASSRFQVQEIGGAVREVREVALRIEGGTLAIRQDTSAIKGDTSAIKADTSAIKGDTSAIKADTAAIKADTSEMKQLLREIRDRLPPAA